MRTRMFHAGSHTIWLLLLLWPLLLSSCSHTASHSRVGIGSDHCAACEPGSTTLAPTPAPVSAPILAPAVSSYGGQITCPVSGTALGSAGPAVPVTVKGQTIYVCCQGCVAKVQADPDTYLARVAAEREPQVGVRP